MASEHRSRWIRRLLTVMLLVALLFPVARDRDGLPLSTYPMYAHTPSSETLFVVAVGVAPDGSDVMLSMPTVADTRDPLIAQAYLSDAVVRADTDQVCQQIAARLAASADDVDVVEIATERHDVVRRVRGEPSLLGRELHSECAVG